MPYSIGFPECLAEYIRLIGEAIKNNSHHDERRHLFVHFLHNAFDVDPVEIQIEKKVKVAKVNGRIDAFFKSTIFEFKTSIEKEHHVAMSELKKYFEAQVNPNDYLAVLTDGLAFELFQWNKGMIESLSHFKLGFETSPLEAFRFFDQFIFSSKPVVPTSGDIIKRFGLYSAVFNSCRLLLASMFEDVKMDSAVKVKLKEWNFLLAKVYGSELGEPSLFIRHSYLTMFARLLVAKSLYPKESKTDKDYRGLLTGEYFINKNLPNLVEPDFFSWAVDTAQEDNFIGFLVKLERYFDIYDLKHISEDILKGLYQELVDPESRHSLGEYYTPDWLAELTLEIINYIKGRLLDPSCGSGTFVFKAIKRKRDSGLKGVNLLEECLKTIIGIDVHPLAVMMTKANMLLALSEEIKNYHKGVYLQIYLADTLLVTEDIKKDCIIIPVSSNERFYIPLDTVRRKINLDSLVDKLSEYAHAAAKGIKLAEAFKGLEKTLMRDFDHKEISFWRMNFYLMTRLIKSKRNSIWSFILKNTYRPAFLRLEKVDYIVGNPPWLSYRYIKDAQYKSRVKELTFELSLLKKTDVKLFTQMDTSTVFFKYCVRDFLNPGGTIAFVMPKTTILPAKQHAMFQQGSFAKILDFSEVQPLFNVRSVVLIRKEGEPPTVPISVIHFKGTLPYKNMIWQDAKKYIAQDKSIHSFMDTNIRSPYYHQQFFQGATLVPRCLWFVQKIPDSVTNVNAPFLETSAETLKESKKPWQLKHQGRAEAEYLFETVLAKGLLPFTILRRELIFLPIKGLDNKVVFQSAPDLVSEGKIYATQWVQDAEKIWEERRSSEDRSLFQRLDYNNTLSTQNPSKEIVVLYNTSGTNLTAALFTPNNKLGEFKINGFIADAKTYYYYPKSTEEGDYLCAVLNSNIVNQMIKAYQPEGLYGERDIHRRPFEACPIPLFDIENLEHIELSNLGKKCREFLENKVLKTQGRLGNNRLMIKKLINDVIMKIDQVVMSIFEKEGQNVSGVYSKKTKIGQDILF